MTPRDTLAALARGERPQAGLLHSCAFAGMGGEAYGEEAIVARIRQAPGALSDGAELFEAAGHVALFDGARAWFADVYDGHIGRLWLLTNDGDGGAEPAIAVPFDPDLCQARGAVLFAAGDHPALDPDGAGAVVALGQRIVAAGPEPRCRAFVIRAFGDARSGAALFAVHRLRPGARPVAGFVHAAGWWRGTANGDLHDGAGERALVRWTPRITR